MTLDGQTLLVVSLFPHQVRPVGRSEIAQARTVAWSAEEERAGRVSTTNWTGTTGSQKKN